ncbi:MAG: hypothetical protein V7638_2967 [Acidobacteriota bacterium]
MTAQLAAEKPTIKILLYTDDPRSITDGTKLLGLSSMIERLKAHSPAFADLEVKLVSRSSTNDARADNKLNVVLEREVAEKRAPFDEIWFFGLHQANTESGKFPFAIPRGGPENELEEAEVEALKRWMKINDDGTGGGGVLMTGDHNSLAPANRLPGKNGSVKITNDTLVGLGRALGQAVPRAGELRGWIGPPSTSRTDSFNTIASTGFQTDFRPQALQLQKFNAVGNLDPSGTAHPLFFYRGDQLIDVFPDHAHEGALVIPDISDTEVWPKGENGQPRPVVAALGQDHLHDKQVSVVTAYDGDTAGVGRIVADSSWHHYLNINLKGFPHPAPIPSDSDKIGQFYGNVAVWLAPRHKRQQMAQAMAWELAEYTKLLENAGDPSELGEIGDMILKRAASPCEAHELMRALAPGQSAAESFAGDTTLGRRTSLRRETLGSVLWSYHDAMTQAEKAVTELNTLSATTVIRQGVSRALAAGANSSSFANNTTDRVSRSDERSNEMACTGEDREWTIEMKSDTPENSIGLPDTLVFCLNNQTGIITGNVSRSEGTFLATVTGTHKFVFDSPAVGFMTVDFKFNGADVTMAGATLKDDETTFFDGRFRTFEPNGNGTNSNDISALTLGTGDTGSSTGQTT